VRGRIADLVDVGLDRVFQIKTEKKVLVKMFEMKTLLK
jgi:hypothetical protein